MKRTIPNEMLPGLPRGEAEPFNLLLEDLRQLDFDDIRPLPAIPNWSKADAYPKVLSLRAWGWEFLRRNPEYKLDWAYNDLRPARWGLAAAIDPGLSPCEPALVPGFAAVARAGFRARPGYYPTYLRVWDGRCAGETISTLGAVLYPDSSQPEDAIKKDIAAALRLVWFNFEHLLFTP
jgi:hypothetical protein